MNGLKLPLRMNDAESNRSTTMTTPAKTLKTGEVFFVGELSELGELFIIGELSELGELKFVKFAKFADFSFAKFADFIFADTLVERPRKEKKAATIRVNTS